MARDTKLFARLYDVGGAVHNVKHPTYSAVGDGVADDTTAIQDALDAAEADGGVVLVPPGQYLITDELVMPSRVRLIGSGGFDTGPTERDVHFVWGGGDEPNKAILRCSTEEIGGGEPTSALINIAVENISFDGDSLAGYGIYAAYVSRDSRFYNLSVNRTTQHGFWGGKLWYVSIEKIVARRNDGCGITIGNEPGAWASTARPNGVYVADLRAHENGRDEAFDEDTNLEWGYGVGFYPGNGMILRHVVSEQNYGPGVIYGLRAGASHGIHSLYLESNAEDAVANGDATRNWALVVIGDSNARANRVETVRLGGSIGSDPQSVWLTGDEPTGDFVIQDIAFGQHLKADWHNYTLQGYVYAGMSQYIDGHTPKADAEVNSTGGLTTLFVRDAGDDDNDGRSASDAFATIERAVSVARYLSTVTTIDCTGLTLGDEDLDFEHYTAGRTITIDGGGTATQSASSGDGLTVRNATCSLNITDFSDLDRVLVDNCRDVRLGDSTVALDDGSSTAAVDVSASRLRIRSCTIDGGSGTNASAAGVDAKDNSEVAVEDTTFTDVNSDRIHRLRTGSVIRVDSDGDQAGVRFEDDDCFWFSPARVKSSDGDATLS